MFPAVNGQRQMKSSRKDNAAIWIITFVLCLFAQRASCTNSFTFATFAGQSGTSGTNDGFGGAARFLGPAFLTVDSLDNLYVSDNGNHTIRKVSPAGFVTTIAGGAGVSGSVDGAVNVARFHLPGAVVLDSFGNLFVTDGGNRTVRKITPGGTVTTLAGSPGESGSADGLGSAARFGGSFGIAIDRANNLYVTDVANKTIRKITPAGAVSTLAGLAGVAGTADGAGSTARFDYPIGIALDNTGNIFVTEQYVHTIRKITPDGTVSTFVGLAGVNGSTDGVGSAARLSFPLGITVDAANNLFVADQVGTNGRIRKVTASGVVTTVSTNEFAVSGLVADSSGNLFSTVFWECIVQKGVGPSALSLGVFPVLALDYGVGTRLRIEVTSSLSDSNNWTTLTNITVSSNPQYFVDTNSPLSLRRFYRAVRP